MATNDPKDTNAAKEAKAAEEAKAGKGAADSKAAKAGNAAKATSDKSRSESRGTRDKTSTFSGSGSGGGSGGGASGGGGGGGGGGYVFDPRGLPTRETPEETKQERQRVIDQVTAVVDAELAATVPTGELKDSLRSFVLGAMSLDGFLEQDVEAQRRHVTDLRFESEQTTKFIDGSTRKNRAAYEKIDASLRTVRGAMNGSGLGYFEELAFVSRRLLRNANEVPVDASGIGQRVAVALSEYEAPSAGGNLNLPSLSSPIVAEADLEQDNIRAIALIYAAWNLEELKLFQVLDRVVEVFMNGQLPVGFDNGGRALSEYYFDDDDQRLTEAARRMTYSRVLGVPGGEVSKEAPPNRPFQDLLLRFLASVSEFERQRRIDDVVGTRSRIDVLSNTGEQVRKAGFDLAANASLYGYGGTFFVAQRLAKQIERALRILSVPEVLSSYGVQSPFQVIERVCATDLGGTVPNVVQRRTMADAGKALLDLVAKYVAFWPRATSRPLFGELIEVVDSRNGDGAIRRGDSVLVQRDGDITREDQQKIALSVEQWLAVNGISDDQRARLGEPQMTAAAPSIPSGPQHGASPAFDQLRQMVSAGQTPSLDQLKALMPDAGGMARM